jgi:molecular chaperone GrpE
MSAKPEVPQGEEPDQKSGGRGVSQPENAGEAPADVQKDEQQAPVKELEAEIAALKDRLIRELAEQENIRMRARREREEAVNFAAGDFAKDLVSSLDDLRRAIESFPQDLRSDSRLNEVAAGLDATGRSFLKVFDKHGITRLEPFGEVFDPGRHEALYLVEDTDEAPGTVIAVLEPGYLYHGRLLRPAKVSVAKG